MSDLYVTRPVLPNETTTISDKTSGEAHTVFDGEVNLRLEFDDLIDKRGHWIVYRRMSSDVCPNYDPNTGEEHTNTCPYCMGLKYMFRDYLVKSYCRLSADVEAQAKEARQDIGYMSVGKYVYYLKAMFTDPATQETKLLNPTDGDFILEVDLDENATPIKVYRTKRILNIQFIHEFRDQGGRVEYYALFSAGRPTGK